MLSQTFVSALVILAVSSGCFAKPILWRPSLSRRSSEPSKAPSFNNYQGNSKMSNFDSFNGVDNFGGNSNKIVIEQETIRVCHSVEIEVIQQQLTIIREFTKKLITEQICETEIQTVILEQFSSGMSGFSKDVRRKSGKPPAYDKNVASMISKIMPNANGDVATSNLGFNGTSVGSNAVQVKGDNWNDATSPNTTAAAYTMAKLAAGSDNSTSSNSSSASNGTSTASSAPASSATASSATASASYAPSSSATASYSTAPSANASATGV